MCYFIYSTEKHSDFRHHRIRGSELSPDEAITILTEGNNRYVANKSEYPNQNQRRRNLTSSKGQHPFATVLTCSDSRVPVEILFDRGIGDIFVIRVAGNVVDIDEAGSIEYGVDHLATPVLGILGHTHCGAVTAVVHEEKLHGKIPPLVDNIIPAVIKAKEKHPQLHGDALIQEAVIFNVWHAIEDLFKISPTTVKRIKRGNLKVVGAIYDIESGKVAWLGPHPKQNKLMAEYGDKVSAHEGEHQHHTK
ncbi:MAG: carbonic anhydrase [Deltaproteobacteria bacterium]|nr:carbonic anhydrase [Deltaproteobacteria bacterium]